MKTPQCAACLILADDYGDNPCTFYCQLEPGHDGRHREILDRHHIEWDGDDSGWKPEDVKP